MNKLFLFLVLTIIYYVLLFYWDGKRKKAFKLTQQKVIGETTGLPATEEKNTQALFGNTNLEKALEKVPTLTPSKDEILLKNLDFEGDQLEKELEELAIDLEAEQTIETPQNKLMEQLAQSTTDSISEEQLNNMVKTISKRHA
ncbi:MAG: hypothetical protein AB8G86_21090 [Saprospiraceae bacterium]